MYDQAPVKNDKLPNPIFTDIISRKYEIRDETNSPIYAALNS